MSHALPEEVCYIFQFVDKALAIDFIIHVAIFLLAGQNAHLLHQIQMPGYNRPVLRHMIGDRADVGSTLSHYELQYVKANRFAQCLEKF